MMNSLRVFFFLTILTLILVGAGGALGGTGGAMLALIIAGVMNFVSYWFSDRIVISMYRGQPVQSGLLFEVVAEICQRNRLPMPKVFILPQPTPNAFATGRNREHASVAATEGLMQILTREELRGVMAHEMAHVVNRDILISSIAATIAGAISFLAQMAQWSMIFGGGRDDDEGSNPIALIAMMILAPIAAMLVQMAISRSREYGADSGGAKLCGNPHDLANALRKLERANEQIPMHQPNAATAHMFIVNPLRGGLRTLFSTHPPVEERVRRLESMLRV
ncbi:MAG: protease HtpX [Desulfuromonadales bacterium GWD2_61_12]|nr:MAG: protease HtpX [Desulfuromonadales bacterium GWC2_61_20]OGR33901.1 MAG: protease HtpX [Desulfuromonadales bacterium GWD2_61_12]